MVHLEYQQLDHTVWRVSEKNKIKNKIKNKMSFLKKIIRDIYYHLYNNHEIHIQSHLFDYGKVTYDGKTLVLKTPTLSEYISTEVNETKDLPLSRKFYGQSPILPSSLKLKKDILDLDSDYEYKLIDWAELIEKNEKEIKQT
jgi:hypothetical protein